ncbi:MAG: cytochrome c-type biogenesis protein CcmH [Enterobacterales bacterium]|nr:cytochrome c-type biogenesis protein CcmH [Enterobacterales bacterium]
MISKIVQQIIISSLLLFSIQVIGAIDSYEFKDPEIAKRFHTLTYELRCPKCQNQNLADSNSTLSMDLKQIVYEKLLAGESDEQILQFMKQRYGEFILFRPEMTKSNAFLWTGPIIFLTIFLILFFNWYRKNRMMNDE